MADAPERILAHPTERNPVNKEWQRGKWKDHDSGASGDVEYIRADLAHPAPTLAEALALPEVQALVEALRTLLIAADGESYADYFGAIETAAAALARIGEGGE